MRTCVVRSIFLTSITSGCACGCAGVLIEALLHSLLTHWRGRILFLRMNSRTHTHTFRHMHCATVHVNSNLRHHSLIRFLFFQITHHVPVLCPLLSLSIEYQSRLSFGPCSQHPQNHRRHLSKTVFTRPHWIMYRHTVGPRKRLQQPSGLPTYPCPWWEG